MSDSDDEYMDISDINFNKKDENFDKAEDLKKEGFPVYQIQSKSNNSIGYIMNVGLFTKVSDVIINKFNISTQIACIMMSCIHDKNNLKSRSNFCEFEMIKILINHNNGIKISPIASMFLNFNTFDHKVKKKSIMEYVSTKDNKKKLEGFFTITLHFKDKKVILEKYKTYLGIKKLIDEMIRNLADNKVKNIINELICSVIV